MVFFLSFATEKQTNSASFGAGIDNRHVASSGFLYRYATRQLHYQYNIYLMQHICVESIVKIGWYSHTSFGKLLKANLQKWFTFFVSHYSSNFGSLSLHIISHSSISRFEEFIKRAKFSNLAIAQIRICRPRIADAFADRSSVDGNNNFT